MQGAAADMLLVVWNHHGFGPQTLLGHEGPGPRPQPPCLALVACLPWHCPDLVNVFYAQAVSSTVQTHGQLVVRVVVQSIERSSNKTNVYMYMLYVFICIHTHTYIYISMYVCMYVYIYIYITDVCVCVYVYMYVHLLLSACLPACLPVCLSLCSMYVCTCMHVCT